jgi:hypothetical protein
MNFCSNCGAPIAQRIPSGDSLPSHVCDRCGEIHGRNLKIVVGSVPSTTASSCCAAGRWSRATGTGRCRQRFLENDETPAQGTALGDPFHRDALAKPVRFQEKYRDYM